MSNSSPPDSKKASWLRLVGFGLSAEARGPAIAIALLAFIAGMLVDDVAFGVRRIGERVEAIAAESASGHAELKTSNDGITAAVANLERTMVRGHARIVRSNIVASCRDKRTEAELAACLSTLLGLTEDAAELRKDGPR